MEQKQLRLEIAQDMLDYVEIDFNFLNTVITGVRPRNKGAVLTMETFVIPEAKENTAGPQQRRGFVDRLSRLPWSGASRIRTTRPNRHQRVIRGGTLSPS